MEDLLAMGFTLKDAQSALQKSNGNVEIALDLLLNSSISDQVFYSFVFLKVI